MVHVAEGSVIIYRPVTNVWTHIATAGNVPTYLPGTHSVTTAKHLRQGTGLSGESAFMGMQSPWSATINKFEEPKLISADVTISAAADGACKADFDISLEPVAEGTLVSVTLTVQNGFQGIFGAIADEVVTIAYSRSLQAHLLNLADWLDSGKRRNLTTRHREVLRMIQQGLTDREIAEKLYISPKTVGHHVSAILAAFRVTQRQDLRRSSELPD